MFDKMENAARRNKELSKGKNPFEENKVDEIVAKHIRTAFIGALDKFESYFGRIWGIGLPISERSENEKKWGKVWADCRDDVLDLGNRELRRALSEVSGKGDNNGNR